VPWGAAMGTVCCTSARDQEFSSALSGGLGPDTHKCLPDIVDVNQLFPAHATPTARASKPRCYGAFTPGKLWLDSHGRQIRAHRGSFIEESGTTYWFGEELATEPNEIINVYRSSDLYNWTFSGVAANVGVPMGRPKVLYNDSTGYYVMLCQSNKFVLACTSSSIVGPFMVASQFMPNDEEVDELNAFKCPETGRAFLMYTTASSVEDKYVLRVVEMTSDMLNVTSSYSTIRGNWIAPVGFYAPQVQRYFVWGSLAGDSPASVTSAIPHNFTVYCTSNLAGAETSWHESRNPGGSATGQGGHAATVLPYRNGANETRFVLVAYHYDWRRHGNERQHYNPGPARGRYVWLPMDIRSDGGVRLKYREQWTLDMLNQEQVEIDRQMSDEVEQSQEEYLQQMAANSIDNRAQWAAAWLRRQKELEWEQDLESSNEF